jgi:hypothetical protein
MLDIAVSRAQRLKEIKAAGGFVVEVDILELRNEAGIFMGSVDYKEKGIAVVVSNPEKKPKSDKLYVNGTAYDIAGNFQPDDRVRIEIDTDDFEKTTEASITVYFGDEKVIDAHPFKWKKAPLGFHLAAIGGKTVFDNLAIKTAEPTIEFAGWDHKWKASNPAVNVNVVLKNGQPNWDYIVDCIVTGGSAVQGVDYIFENQRLEFEEGKGSKAVELNFIRGKKYEADKTIELSLVNPRGGNLSLGGKRLLVYTITGEYPMVQFSRNSLSVNEGDGSGDIEVVLSHKCDKTVTIDYKVVGGNAENGKDYNLKDGKITFKPGKISSNINVDVLDDTNAENSIDETVVIQLVNPGNCVIGENNISEFGITDNELWVEFDGAMWICSHNKHKKIKGQKVLSLNEEGQLDWVCTYGAMLYAKLPTKSITKVVAKVGEIARYGWLYKGDGQDKGSYVENICERYGSGDLRLSMLDLGEKSMSIDKQYKRNDKIFCGSRGYTARLSPHVPTNERADKWATKTNPSGSNCHSPVSWGGCWGFPTYFNGYGVTVGEFTPMLVSLARTAEDTVAFSVTMNGIEHIMVDKDKAVQYADKDKMESLYGEGDFTVQVVPGYQPQKIDTMAFYFANQRPFDLITFAPLEE